MNWIVIGVVLLLAALFEVWVELIAQNHPWRVAIVGGVVFLLVGAILFLWPSGPLITLTLLLAGAWAWALVAGLDARDHELGYYCRYGAQTQTELDRCMSSINTDEIEELDTPAARFAVGVRTECGPGSGRFCREAAKDAAIEYGG
ncbi:MAG TPA: hypothetical protein VF517_10245 [Thermoleophilaceae bacterium]|jgi:hypothetical protein